MNKALLRQGNKYSLSFDGVNDYVDLNTALTDLLPLTEGTISLFLKKATNGAVFSINDSSQSARGVFEISWTSDDLRVVGYTTGYLLLIRITPSDFPGLFDNWIHFIYKSDATGNKLYLNGVDMTTTVTYWHGSSASHVFINQASGTYGNRCSLGRRSNLNTLYCGGKVDRLRIYGRVLSHDEVKMLYRGIEPSTIDLVQSLDMKEGTGTSIKDLSGNDNDGTLVNGVAWSTDVPTWGSA